MWFTLENMQGCENLPSLPEQGGGILGGKMLGWRTVCAVEIEKYPRSVLLQRQKDGILDKFPIWDDVRTFDGRPWRGKVDVISGGFPCQDISSAGKGLGIERGERSGLWREYARIICEVRPRYCFVENSPMLTVRGLGIVLGDLAERGYDAAWKVLSAGDCGAPHERARMWIVAKDTNSEIERRDRRDDQSEDPSCELIRQPEKRADGVRDEMADAVQNGLQRRGKDGNIPRQIGLRGGTGTHEIECLSDSVQHWERWIACSKEAERYSWSRNWWASEPGLGRVADGVANRVDRIKADGNGQVPIVVVGAFCDLMEVLENA